MKTEKVLIDMSGWKRPESGVFGSYIQYFTNELNKKVGGFEYMEIDDYPVIKLPLVVENTDFFPILSFTNRVTYGDSLETGVSNILLGTSDGYKIEHYVLQYGIMRNNGASSGTATIGHATNSKIVVSINADYLDKYGFYSIGIYADNSATEVKIQSDSYFIGTPGIICKLVSAIDSSEVNGTMSAGFYYRDNKEFLPFVVDGEISSVSHKYSTETNIVITDDFNCGKYYHRKLKFVHPISNSMISGAANYVTQAPKSKNVWRKNALVVDGNSYDIMLCSNDTYYTLIIPSITE